MKYLMQFVLILKNVKSLISDKGETINISRTQRYKLIGNAVTVNVVQMIAERLIDN